MKKTQTGVYICEVNATYTGNNHVWYNIREDYNREDFAHIDANVYIPSGCSSTLESSDPKFVYPRAQLIYRG